MALTDADRLQIVAMALMRHSVVGGGSAPAESLIKYFKKYTPLDNVEFSYSRIIITPQQVTSISASSEFSSTYAASKSVDKDTATYWSTTTAGVAPCWLDATISSSTTLHQYSIRSRADANNGTPKAWSLQGWNGTGWTTLDSRSSETTWANGEKRTYAITGAASYSRYRLYITENNGRTTTNIAEFSLEVLS